MANKTPQGLQLLLALIVLNILTTIGHYVDNICYFTDYPEPSWLNPLLVDAFWFVMTPFAAFGYWYYVRGWNQLANAALVAYCLMSLLVLGHYLIAPPWKISLRINALILSGGGCCHDLVAVCLSRAAEG